MPKIPDSYRQGVQYIEGLQNPELREWLVRELTCVSHVLSGSIDDQPVQAIVNHHRYLTVEAAAEIEEALQVLVVAWLHDKNKERLQYDINLFDLVTALHVKGINAYLKHALENYARYNEDEVLRIVTALANQPVRTDREFWIDSSRPWMNKFMDLRRQVLNRIY